MKTKIANILSVLTLITSFAFAAPSAPKSEPKAAPEVVSYNDGVDLLMKKNFKAAAERFIEALAESENFAEAHNNLAYALRKQGADNYPKSLQHYNRAIELDGNLAEAYMYRGVLFVAMGDSGAANADLAQLKKLKSPLAKELEDVIESGSEKSPERFFGVTEKI